MVTNNVDFIKNYFHQVSPDIDSEEVTKQFCKDIDKIPGYLDIFHMDMFMTPNLDGIIYIITLVSEQSISQEDMDKVRNWVFKIFPDEDIRTATTKLIAKNNILQTTLTITFND